MHVVVLAQDGQTVELEVSETTLVGEIVTRAITLLHLEPTPGLILSNSCTGQLLPPEETVHLTELKDGDQLFLHVPARAGGMSPEQFMGWLSTLVSQARSIPLDDLMKYLSWVVTASRAVELVRRGAGTVRRLVRHRPGKLEDVVKQVRTQTAWNPHDLAVLTGLSPADTKGLLRILGFRYNRRTQRYETGDSA